MALQILKQLLLKVAPATGHALQRAHQRRHQQKFEEGLGMPRIGKAYVDKNGLTVLSGPFKGMDYLPEATGSMFIPKLVGCYEREIVSQVEGLIARNPHTVVDIGCAEGYYAVGLAKRLPAARVVAFDSDPHARKLCALLAEKNHAAVEVRGLCEFEPFETLLQQSKGGDGNISALVVCDCDGCEAFLLDPAKVPSLQHSDILVETHDHIDSAITPTLRKNFEGSHTIEYVPSTIRDISQHPEVHFMSPEDQNKALSEYRPPQGWLIMRPRTTA